MCVPKKDSIIHHRFIWVMFKTAENNMEQILTYTVVTWQHSAPSQRAPAHSGMKHEPSTDVCVRVCVPRRLNVLHVCVDHRSSSNQAMHVCVFHVSQSVQSLQRHMVNSLWFGSQFLSANRVWTLFLTLWTWSNSFFFFFFVHHEYQLPETEQQNVELLVDLSVLMN